MWVLEDEFFLFVIIDFLFGYFKDGMFNLDSWGFFGYVNLWDFVFFFYVVEGFFFDVM